MRIKFYCKSCFYLPEDKMSSILKDFCSELQSMSVKWNLKYRTPDWSLKTTTSHYKPHSFNVMLHNRINAGMNCSVAWTWAKQRKLYQLGLLGSTGLQFLWLKNHSGICQRLFEFHHTKLSREISEQFPWSVMDATARNGKTQTVTEWNH